MHSFGFWQQGVAPGDWSRGVIARNLDGEDFKGYRRASDPSHLRDTGSLLPEARDAQPDEIVVETGSVVAGLDADGTAAAIGRLVAAYGGEDDRGAIDADALVQPARADLYGADLYGIELVDTVAAAARRAGLEGSPMHAAIRGMDATPVAAEDSLGEIGLLRRETDRETEAVPADAEPVRFDAASQPLIQSADDFLML
ncbi:hypothetical protein [Nisaea sp.]|uniref:hypothetical protein n=1 Tax=Nisaea sp. TaxID=2024842 RepID=UPI002B269B02|nr:hypothetical protein [Nisaea sp.]